MKLRRLLLHAFGPFTDKELSFADDGRHAELNLHLIYGPNEAGKSSALRAMMDLRFGIPLRSPDDFLHLSKDLRVAGVFADADDNPIGLVRRKGRKATLMLFDPAQGHLVPGEEAGPRHELALTGGLGRDEFEAMFGLDHARLREGGDRLVNGEGELGAALFEASAGTRGISGILASLDDDAKALFSPRSKNAVINEARRALDDHRKAWKAAQTRPAEWREVNRAHQKASDALAEIRRNLERERRRENELTELRTVAPLLRDHDRALTDLQALADAPDLPENAREERLGAQQALQHAQDDMQAAEQALVRCNQALGALQIETPLLAHAEVIERLAGAVDVVERSRVEVQQHQVAIDQSTEILKATAARIDPLRTAAEIVAVLPSDAELAAVNEHLAAIPVLTDRLMGYQQRADELERAATLEADDEVALPDASARQGVENALGFAQELGDVERRLTDLDRDLSELAGELDRALSDLGLGSIAAVRRCRPLLDAQIDAAADRSTAIDGAMRELASEAQRIEADAAQQSLRKRQLAAVGEVVTSETLDRARERRDHGWALVRRAYVEGVDDPARLGQSFDTQRPLADAFEIAQEAADRQADLLRADAARATSFEECVARLQEMVGRRTVIGEELAVLSERRQQALDEWAGLLAEAGLPELDPEGLREWQARRATALDLAGRLDGLQNDRQRLLTGQTRAVEGLTTALQAVGHAMPPSDLSSLVAQAVRWERQATALQVRHEERASARRARRVDRDRLEGRSAEARADLQHRDEALAAWRDRLSLSPDSPAASVKARLDELYGLARRAAELSQIRLRQAQEQAVVDDFRQQARNLAEVLDEPLGEMIDDFAECLRRRLKTALENERQRLSLGKDRARAESERAGAAAELERQSAALLRLCAAAGVETVAELPECEARAARKRRMQAALDARREQLAQASTRPESELRERLGDRDTIGLDSERQACREEIGRLEDEQARAARAEEEARRALGAIDASDAAARAREAMESAAARCQAAVRPWVRLRLAHALLRESLKRFRERAQAPMVSAASTYFSLMTSGRYQRLVVDEADEKPMLLAEREDAVRIGVDAMSEGTADQLYLALRLAALEMRRESHPQMPLVLDDVLVTSDDQRACNILQALAKFAEGGQVMLFTHHRHVIDLARSVLGDGTFAEHHL